MEQFEILATIAGYHPALVRPPTDRSHPYRVQIPGLSVDVPVYWDQHMARLGKEETGEP